MRSQACGEVMALEDRACFLKLPCTSSLRHLNCEIFGGLGIGL